MAMDLKNATFWGYRRDNGRVGVRNHVVVLPVPHQGPDARLALPLRLDRLPVENSQRFT